MFHVKKRTLLLIAGIVWLIAGFNVARLGVLSYRVIESKWYLYILTIVVFCAFGMMFFKMSQKHTKRIMGYEATRPFWHFFDLKAYMIMACMMGGGIGFSSRYLSRYLYCLFLFRTWLCISLSRCYFFKKLYSI